VTVTKDWRRRRKMGSYISYEALGDEGRLHKKEKKNGEKGKARTYQAV